MSVFFDILVVVLLLRCLVLCIWLRSIIWRIFWLSWVSINICIGIGIMSLRMNVYLIWIL